MRRLAVILLTAALTLPATSAHAAGLGFGAGADEAAAAPAVATQMGALGARWLRIDVRWDEVAPTRPARPRRPVDPAYLWADVDRLVRRLGALRWDVSGRSRRPLLLLSLSGAPDWAAAPDAPALRASFASFAAAVARRYRRSADAYELLAEPNRAADGIDQRVAGRLRAPAVHAALVSRAARAVRAVDRAPIVAGGVARDVGEDGIPPAAFLRALGRIGLPAWVAIGVRLSPAGAETAAAGTDDLALSEPAALVAAVDAAFPARRRSIWVTGYAVAADADQAGAVGVLLAAAREPRVRAAIWGDLAGGANGLFDAADGVLAARPAVAAWAAARRQAPS